MKYQNISAYKFVQLDLQKLPDLQQQLRQNALTYALKGTILLSAEGINLFLAGEENNITLFIQLLRNHTEFSDMQFKVSKSTTIPFKRLLVRIKKEIITMGHPEIQPEKKTAPYLEPAQLQEWYKNNKDIVVLDTRNNYEYAVGSFDKAIHFNIENFTDFPQAIAALPESYKSKTIVTFCTGGIRCEKAAAFMMAQGFNEVYQLKGGILNYFEHCGNDHFQGDCFVFDERTTITPQEVHPSKLSANKSDPTSL